MSKISELTEQALTVSQREEGSYKTVRLNGCSGSHLLQVEETIDWPKCEPRTTLLKYLCTEIFSLPANRYLV